MMKVEETQSVLTPLIGAVVRDQAYALWSYCGDRANIPRNDEMCVEM